MKGSCNKIPCEYSQGKCNCKQYCINCCGNLPECYKSKNFEEFKTKWKEVTAKYGKQLQLF